MLWGDETCGPVQVKNLEVHQRTNCETSQCPVSIEKNVYHIPFDESGPVLKVSAF